MSYNLLCTGAGCSAQTRATRECRPGSDTGSGERFEQGTQGLSECPYYSANKVGKDVSCLLGSNKLPQQQANDLLEWRSGMEVSIYALCAGVSRMQHLLSESQMQQSLERVLAPGWGTPVPITSSIFSTRFAGSPRPWFRRSRSCCIRLPTGFLQDRVSLSHRCV